MKRHYRLLGDRRSGNCFKVALMLHRRGLPFSWVETDVLAGATRTPDFLAINPNGRVPLLQLPDRSWLAESNAMLIHLAEGTDLLPEADADRARVFQWLFFEQYSHEPYIAVARFLLRFAPLQPPDPGRLAELHDRGHQALGVMETVLTTSPFIAGRSFTIADMALYAYTHVANEGGFDVSVYPAVRAWLERCRAQAGHFDLADLPQVLETAMSPPRGIG